MEKSQSIRNLAVDPVEEKIYFMSGGVVSRANFDGSGKEIIHESRVVAFALDSVERRMYWWNGYWIYKANMNFSEVEGTGLRALKYNLVVDPYSRLVMYFLTTRTLSESVWVKSKWRTNFLPWANSLITLRERVTTFRVFPKKYISSNFLPGLYTEGIKS